LLDDVEHGETVVISSHGRAIARLVLEAHLRQAEIDQAIDAIKRLRARVGKPTPEELLSAGTKGTNINTVRAGCVHRVGRPPSAQRLRRGLFGAGAAGRNPVRDA
jgi:antitoxin (DNA-binding transcriptional repressor) of toxin-antitoxin stability system